MLKPAMTALAALFLVFGVTACEEQQEAETPLGTEQEYEQEGAIEEEPMQEEETFGTEEPLQEEEQEGLGQQ